MNKDDPRTSGVTNLKPNFQYNLMDEVQFDGLVRSEINQYVCNGREESAAFLVWYLKNFFRIEEQDAIDSVCDSSNDKGIDGIYVDDEEEAVYLFQSKFSQQRDMDQGDNDIRNFKGAKQWFVDQASIQRLLTSTANPILKSLVLGLKLEEKIGSKYNIFLQFITNKKFDANANEFLALNKDLEGVDANDLYKKYTYLADEEIITSPINLSLANNTHIDYALPNGTQVSVYSIRAKELLRLQGISDKTLFYKNVRYGLGRTRVNKDIRDTIMDANEHNNFFLYHNGITIVCGGFDVGTPNRLIINNYTVINGCQSILTLYENRDAVTENIYLLVKFIKLDTASSLIQKITYYANNQNSISLIDLKSNDRVQKGLKKEFNEMFNHKVLYKIKRGESETGYDEVIEIDFAAQLIESLFNNAPWTTYVKATLFSEHYYKIFSRNITAEKIYLANVIYEIIKSNSSLLHNEQIRSYGLARFFFTHLIGEMMKEDELGKLVLANPKEYVTTDLTILKNTISKLWGLITPDINAYIDKYGEEHENFFDYKNVFKNSSFVKEMTRQIKADQERILIRHPEDSFKSIFETFKTEPALQ